MLDILKVDDQGWKLLVVSGSIAFFVVQHMVSVKRSEYVPLALVVVAVISYFAYTKLLDKVDTKNKEMADIDKIDSEDKPIGNKLIRSNPVLVKLLIELSRYSYIDNHAFDIMIKTLFEFYQLYGKILMGKKPPAKHYATLFGMRKDIMNTMYSFYSKRAWLNDDKRFRKALQNMFIITRIPLQVLKNKFHEQVPNDFVYPVPHNVFDTHDIV